MIFVLAEFFYVKPPVCCRFFWFIFYRHFVGSCGLRLRIDVFLMRTGPFTPWLCLVKHSHRTWISMTFSYIDFSQTFCLYVFFPLVSLYFCYVVHGILTERCVYGDIGVDLQTKKSLSMGLTLGISLVFIIPVYFTFLLIRGVELSSLTVVSQFSNSSLKWIILLFSCFTLNLYSVSLRKLVSGVSTNSEELVYSYIFILLAWYFVSLSLNLLTFLLALEVVTLLLFLLMCNVGLYHSMGFSEIRQNWITSGYMERVQYSIISTLLSFIWIMGFATIFFLWAVSFMFPLFNSVDFMFVSLVSSNWYSADQVTLYGYALLSGNWLGLALTFKLLLQPFQTFIIVFYKQLPPSVLINYFQFYYIFILLFVFFFIVTPYGFVTLSWHWAFIAYVSGLLVTLLLGTETLRDLSTVLAYSTFVNISFFLLVGGYHSV